MAQGVSLDLPPAVMATNVSRWLHELNSSLSLLMGGCGWVEHVPQVSPGVAVAHGLRAPAAHHVLVER